MDVHETLQKTAGLKSLAIKAKRTAIGRMLSADIYYNDLKITASADVIRHASPKLSPRSKGIDEPDRAGKCRAGRYIRLTGNPDKPDSCSLDHRCSSGRTGRLDYHRHSEPDDKQLT